MSRKEISDETINIVAEHISRKVNQSATIPIITIDGKTTTPHYYEIVPFDEIDKSEARFFAVDGSYNSQEFHNGIYLGVYTAGYLCFHKGKQIRLNDTDNPVILGKSYLPDNILITNDTHRDAIFDELLELSPVRKMLEFFGEEKVDLIWGLGENTRGLMVSSVSKLLSFCQEVLEWALVLEILNLENCESGDFILRDGTLRSNNIKQKYLIKIAGYAKEKGVRLVAVTKNSPIKIELSSSFKRIDTHLETEKKPSYPFTIANKRWQKLCCWIEVPEEVLLKAYPQATDGRKDGEFKLTRYSMYATKNLRGGRGFGLFFAARLDYVEKLQNYDWVIVDLNIFDIIPEIHENMDEQEIQRQIRDTDFLSTLFKEMTRLTQEHYILGYPYPLVEVHNFVSLKNSFKEEAVRRVKASLYQQQMMDHVDIENMFLDIHDRF